MRKQYTRICINVESSALDVFHKSSGFILSSQHDCEEQKYFLVSKETQLFLFHRSYLTEFLSFS